MSAKDHAEPAPAAWIELPDQKTLPLTGDCHIGRVEGNEIVNPDSRISRRHAVIQRQGQRFVLVDLGSTNGTFLNDTRIFTARKLHHRDVILVGSLRYIFNQPSLTVVSTVGESGTHTVVAVGKTNCWMVLVAPPEPPDFAAVAWAEQMRKELAGGGAGLKRVRGSTFFAHWREGRIAPADLGQLLLALGRQSCPAHARIAVHFGSVRVGPGPNPGEENILGPEATFAHKLDTTAASLAVNFLLTEAAAQALGAPAFIVPVRVRATGSPAGGPPYFTLAAG